MAGRFRQPVDLQPKQLLPDVQLRLRATLVRVNCVLLGRCDDDSSVHVILFRHGSGTKARRQIPEYVHGRFGSTWTPVPARRHHSDRLSRCRIVFSGVG